MHDATLWQPLALDQLVAQNGLPIPGSVQAYVGPHWGRVTGFALDPSPRGVPIDPGDTRLGLPEDKAFKRAALEVIRRSSELGGDGGAIDIGPGALGDNPLGSNSGNGHDGQPRDREAVRPEPGRPGATTAAFSPSSGPTGRARRRRRGTGT